MLTLSSSIKTSGTLPRSLVLEEILSRESLASIAEQIYDANPNIVTLVESGTNSVVIKLFGWRSPIHYYFSPTFPSRAQASWDTAQALLQCGARTPELIFVHTKRKFGFITDNVFITRAIHPHRTFRSLLNSSNSISFIEQAAVDLARSIARMHNSAVFHRYLTAGNFLVNEKGEVFIVDLNRAQLLDKLSIHHRLTDLAKLCFNTENESFKSNLVKRFFSIYDEESAQHPTVMSNLSPPMNLPVHLYPGIHSNLTNQ